jgi:SAM-dependent methyltransferase
MQNRNATSSGELGKNAQHWEEFAGRNAEHYILTERRDYTAPEALRHFFESGESIAEMLLARCRPWMGELDCAVEIGCGVGRLAIPMAGWFREVRGVDVAPSMLSKLDAYCRSKEIANVSGWLAESAWDSPSSASLCYSWIVMQHIEELESIRRYLQRIARALREDGVACLQFDTRAQTALYRLRNRVPDWVLPTVWRHGIRRIRREAGALRSEFGRAGLQVIDEHDPDGEVHTFVLRREA